MVCALTARFSRSPSLKASDVEFRLMAADGADPSLLGQHDGDRLLLDHRLGELGLDAFWRLGEARAAFAERGLLAELVLEGLDLVGDRLPLLVFRGEQRFQLLAFLGQALMLALDLDLLELAQRAQPHVEDGLGLHLGELESLHQRGLRLVLLADDFDDLVDVEIDDEVAVEHLEPVVDLGEAELRAADQHHLAVVEPFAQHLPQAQHVRHLAAAQHIHVERNARLELGQLEHLLHQQEPDRRCGSSARARAAPPRSTRRARRQGAAASSGGEARRCGRRGAPSGSDRGFR